MHVNRITVKENVVGTEVGFRILKILMHFNALIYEYNLKIVLFRLLS